MSVEYTEKTVEEAARVYLMCVILTVTVTVTATLTLTLIGEGFWVERLGSLEQVVSYTTILADGMHCGVRPALFCV